MFKLGGMGHPWRTLNPSLVFIRDDRVVLHPFFFIANLNSYHNGIVFFILIVKNATSSRLYNTMVVLGAQ